MLPKGFRYLTADEERRFSINCENDKTFVSEYDSEKNIFVQSEKKILAENQPEEVSTLFDFLYFRPLCNTLLHSIGKTSIRTNISILRNQSWQWYLSEVFHMY